jgi:serine/threonine protein kinase
MSATPGGDPLVGTKIREYQILDVIGKGGMGAVYRARHIYLDEERAIKVIHTRLAGDRDFIDRFIREARVLSKLKHPNLVQLYEFGPLQEDSFFMVMELIRGESVLERLNRKKRFAVDEAVKIIRQAASGLHSAHQKGIVHRDVSPDNLMLVEDDSGHEITKILDFGIAKPLSEGTHHFTVTNMFIGKPEYSSPEQCGFLEEGETIDRRSDIYSLAVTFYHMLAGRLPFSSQTPQGYLVKHAMEPPKPFSTHVPEGTIPLQIEQTIMKALAKKRQDRHATLEEFIQDLDRAYSLSAAGPVADTLVRGTEEIHIPTSGIEPGNIFAKRYLIEKKLGEGGMGAVYKAIDKILEVPVALKIMSVRIVHDDITLERFKREVILARKVAHPNACRIFDIGEHEGIHYVSMEYLAGRPLSDMIKEENIPLQEGLHIIRQVLEALHEAHRVGIVHRDLKPQNIMVGAHEHAFILDFGISISADVRRVTQTGLIVGTPYYMSPEQFEGKNIDHRADIYSVGVIMYEMFSGKLPFQGNTPMAIIYAHLKSTPPKLTELVPGIDPAIDRIVSKCLEKDAQNRFQSAQEVHQAIEPLLKTPSAMLHQEGIAHQLIAERSFSKAIKFLHTMLESNPENTKWQKLLRGAVYEKTKRDMHRARSAIRKQRLNQAQLIIERIRRTAPKTERTTIYVDRLQKQLNEQRERVIHSFVSEAEQLLKEENWTEASERLQAVSSLVPNDPRVAALQKEMHSLQQKKILRERDEIEKTFQALVADHSQDAQYYEERCQSLISQLQELLKENPSFRAASALKEEIAQFKERKAIELLVTKDLEIALQPLKIGNFSLSNTHLQKLMTQTSDPTVRSIIGKIQKEIHEMGLCFTSGAFEKASSMLENLHRKEFHDWLVPHAPLLNQLKTLIDKKAATKRKFQEILEQGQNFMQNLEWAKAVDSFKEALWIIPEEPSAQKLLAEAEAKAREETSIRENLVSRLNESEKLLTGKKLLEARNILDETRQVLKPDYRLTDLQQKLNNLYGKVESEIQKENIRKEWISKNLEQATHHYEKNDLQSALRAVQDILKSEPEVSAAVQLKKNIQNLMKEKEVQSQNFMHLFEDGKRLYDGGQWQKAIETWEKALEIIPDNQAIREWIDAALHRQAEQNKLREEFAHSVAEFRASLEHHDLDQAQVTMNKIQHLVDNNPQLADFKDQMPALWQELDAETEKIHERQRLIGGHLSEVARLCEAGEMRAALERIDLVLSVEPELEQALALKTQIQKKITDRFTKIKEQLTSAVQFLIREEFMKCLRALETLQRLPHDFDAREMENVIEQITCVVEAIKANNLDEAIRLLQHLPSESSLLTPYSAEFGQMMARLQERQTRLNESKRYFQEGMRFFTVGQWEQAIQLLEHAEKIDSSSVQIHQYLNAARQKLKESQFPKTLYQPPEQQAPFEKQEPPPPVQHQPTIRQEPISHTPPPVQPRAAAPQRAYWFAIPVVAILLTAILGLSTWYFLRKDPTPPVQLNRVKINALPWARVKITPVSSEIKIDPVSADQAATPCLFVLPAGEYNLELENGGLTQPLLQKVQVRDGIENTFEFIMPAYDPNQVMEQVIQNRQKRGTQKR